MLLGVLRFSACVLAALVLAGCGSSKPSASTGCRGLRTAPRPQRLTAGPEVTTAATLAAVCARFGSPAKIKRGHDGAITWTYPRASVTFARDRPIAWEQFEPGARSVTYSITQSLQVMR
jgi:hypothetical protein